MEELLHKYLNNEATDAEIELLKQDADYAAMLELADRTAGLELPTFDQEHNWNEILKKRNSVGRVRSLRPIRSLLKVAAVLALVLTTYLFINSRDTTVSTDLAQKESVILPDQSEVILNAESELSYNKSNWNDSRELSLKGEAYFKVAKGKKFTVETDAGSVSVLGTQFNVRLRADGFQVYCYEGLVQVQTADTIFNLAAGNGMIQETGEVARFKKILESAPSWITHESSFVNSQLSAVLDELSRQYELVIKTNVSEGIRFSGSFTHKDINLALKTICQPLGLNFTISDGIVTIYEEP